LYSESVEIKSIIIREVLKMRKITIRDVAKSVGCSYGTVSRYLNGHSGVHPNTRKRIQQAIEKLDYHPNMFARGLVTKRSNTIAILVPDIANPFFSEIVSNVEHVTHYNGYELITCSAGWDIKAEARRIKMLQEKQIDGLIFKPNCESEDPFSAITIPFVSLSRVENSKFSYVEVENKIGAYMATSYLISRGYNKIAYIGGPRQSETSAERYSGYFQALQENDFQINPKFTPFGNVTLKDGYITMKRLLDLEDRPDSVFCYNDLVAIGAQYAAIESELILPEELGIIGFDDISLASLPQIQLTTIAQPRDEIGRIAAEILIKTIEEKENGNYIQKVMLGPELIVRKSTK
jgi:LacI family transcriptional regulator